jgi:hypothetical protein
VSVRVRLLNLLLAAALLLAGSKLLGLLREPPPALPPIAAEAPPAAEESAPVGPPPAAEAHPEAFDVIVARDPFSPTRGVVQPAPAVAARPAPKPPPPKLTLYGVVILDGERYAYLQEGGADARPKKVKERESIAGGTVTAIRPDAVTFLYGGSEIVLPLRTPKDVPAAAGGTDAAAPARGRAAISAQQRRAPPLPVVPGQMPVGGAAGQMPTQPTQPTPDQPGAGMPVFPSTGEPADDSGVPEEMLPGESPDGGEDQGMPMEGMPE